MAENELLAQIKSRLQQAHGDRLKGVVLYGSEARGEATPDSDIDVLVLLQGPIRLWADLQTSIHALYPLILTQDRPISPKVIDCSDYEREDAPLFENARREGIRA